MDLKLEWTTKFFSWQKNDHRLNIKNFQTHSNQHVICLSGFLWVYKTDGFSRCSCIYE